jgi:hypothetical protein
VWADEVPGMMLPVAGRWEHEDTSVDATGTVGDGPTVVAEDDMVVLLAECRSNGTSLEHPQNYL